MTPQESLAAVAAIAVKLEAETGVPPEFLIAQWAIESDWGSKPVCKCNYFGMKRALRHEMFCVELTEEQVHGERVSVRAEFASYNSLEDSCRDYAWLIVNGSFYHGAWTAYKASRDLYALIAGVAAIYATASNYAALVDEIVNQQNVKDAIAAARK